MPMHFLRQLAQQALPVDIHGDQVEVVIALQQALLIAAEIVPIGFASGRTQFQATVWSVTPAGQRVLRAMATEQM